MFEHKTEPLLPVGAFVGRLARSLGLTMLVVAFSLALGSVGYRYFAGLDWIDALLNAAMILTGMGPVNPLSTPAAKLFATFYALYSGIAFLTMVAILMAPVVHRFLHQLHVDADEESK